MPESFRVPFCILCCFFASFAAADEKDDGFRPRTNVLILNIDAVGYGDLGCYGSKDITTPHIDSLARDGVQFLQAYSTASLDSPSRAGLITGRYQQKFGHEFDLPEKSTDGISATEITLGEAFQKVGYRTMAVGKWNLGTQLPFHPARHGFDEFFGFLGPARSNFPYPDDDPTSDRRLYLNEVPVPESSIAYLTDDIGREAAEFILETIPYPWMMYVSFNTPGILGEKSPPHLAEFESLEPRERRWIAAEVRSLDNAVGKILDALEEVHQQGNTLVILVGSPTSKSASLSEADLRIPMLMRWPGVIPAAKKFSLPVSTLDVVPTSLTAVGETELPERLDGMNLVPFISGEPIEVADRTFYWRQGNTAAIREGDWKFVRTDDQPPKLFNLRVDAQEQTDLLQKPAVVAGILEKKLTVWEGTLAKPKRSGTAENPGK